MNKDGMRYNIDPSFIWKDKAKIISMGLLLLTIGISFTYSYAVELDIKCIIGLVPIWFGYRKLTELTYWKKYQNKLSLEISSKQITFTGSNTVRVLKTENITKAVLQPIHKKVKSIILHTDDGDIIKLEGFKSMDAVADQLKAILGQSKIKTATVFHR